MEDPKKPAVGIIGATGLVGKEILEVLEESEKPVGSIKLFASGESRGVQAGSEEMSARVDELGPGSLQGLDVVFAAAPPGVCRKQLPLIVKSNAIAIDLSGASSLEEDVPLVVCGVNDNIVEEHSGVVASPAAPTVLISLLVEPLRDLGVPIRLAGTLLMPASSKGRQGMDELAGQTVALLSQKEVPSEIFPQRLAFNVIPDVGGFAQGHGQSRMEERIAGEVRRVLEEPDLIVALTALQVPVFVGQAVALEIEIDARVSLESVRNAFENAPDLQLLDTPNEQSYPMPGNVADTDDVLVGRLRIEEGERSRVHVWAACDNLRRGSALNAVGIMEYCIDRGRT